jgi:glycosyltransferase involved in cell wall biosynthesis
VSQAFYQKLQGMVRELGLSEHVVFTGYRTDVPDLLALSDIVVHSSSEPEPFGRVIVEAMLAGKPVIATAAGGPLDIIEDQVTGLLAPIKDSAAMARALGQLLENKAEARAMGQRARESAQRRFSIKQHIAAIQGLYEEILCRGGYRRQRRRGSHKTGSSDLSRQPARIF